MLFKINWPACFSRKFGYNTFVVIVFVFFPIIIMSWTIAKSNFRVTYHREIIIILIQRLHFLGRLQKTRGPRHLPSSFSPCTAPLHGCALEPNLVGAVARTTVIALVGRHRRYSALTVRDGEPRGRRFCISAFVSITRRTPVGFFFWVYLPDIPALPWLPLPRLLCLSYDLLYRWIFLFCAPLHFSNNNDSVCTHFL